MLKMEVRRPYLCFAVSLFCFLNGVISFFGTRVGLGNLLVILVRNINFSKSH